MWYKYARYLCTLLQKQKNRGGEENDKRSVMFFIASKKFFLIQVSWTLSGCLLYLTLRDFNLRDGSQYHVYSVFRMDHVYELYIVEEFSEMEYLGSS